VVHSRAIADALPDAELVVVPGTGHMVQLEAEQLVTRRLRELLGRAARAPEVRTA
jgi:pimeloyl-ACP methyl ester carboxylesterase